LHEYNETLVGIRKDNRMGITIQNDGTKEKTKEHYKGKVRVNAPIKIPMEYTTF
jgi:hypothetical protein